MWDMTSVCVAPSRDLPLTSRISSPISKSALSAGEPAHNTTTKKKKKTPNIKTRPISFLDLFWGRGLKKLFDVNTSLPIQMCSNCIPSQKVWTNPKLGSPASHHSMSNASLMMPAILYQVSQCSSKLSFPLFKANAIAGRLERLISPCPNRRSKIGAMKKTSFSTYSPTVR